MLIREGNLLYEIDEECAARRKIDLSQLRPYVPEMVSVHRMDSPGVLTGRDICAAVLDTGLFPHADFTGRIVAFADLVHGKQYPYDDNGHGTHVTGILGGDGRLSSGRIQGIAPGTKLIGVKVLDEKGKGKLSTLQKGVSWILRHRKKYRIRIVNISIGTLAKSETEEQALLDCIMELWEAGLCVCIAAGNEGAHAITAPGISKAAITVGSYDDEEMIDDAGRQFCNYSGRGPTGVCICKPEIVAPGTNIISTSAMNRTGSSAYCIKSGTSMSVPFVSGAIACLLEGNPHLTNVEVKLRLRETALDLGYPRNHQGWGALNLEALLAH